MLVAEVPVVAAPDAAAPCGHCGAPVFGASATAGEPLFCCAGCASVHALLSGAGLTGYYDARDAAGEGGLPARVTGRTYGELDEPESIALHCRPRSGGGLATELYLEGVHCSACVWLVEKLPRLVPGVIDARLELGRGVVRVDFDPARAAPSQIARALDRLGYASHPVVGLDREAVRRREDRALLMRVGVAGASAGNAMLFAVALYSGAFEGMDAELVALFRAGSVVSALPSLLWSAGVFYRGALASLRTLTPHMDLPIALGLLIGAASGVHNVVTGRGEIYFDTLTMLVFLLLVGRFVQAREQRRAEGAAELVHSLAPGTARLVEGGVAREVPVEAVPIGALVEVRAGERVSVDGAVLEGRSTVDVSLLTGESVPAEVGPGASVFAGSVNLSDRLVLRAEETGRRTRVAGLVARMEEAARARAPIVVAADRLSGWFVLIVVGLAAVTVAVLLPVDPSIALDRAVALLVVTCPCALALATPLTVTAALGRAARAGLLVKGGASLEALGRPGLFVFDKTGTLTEGRVAVIRVEGDGGVAQSLAAAEARSAHPVARAIVAWAGGAAGLEVSGFRESLGGGIEATVGGVALLAGSLRFARERGARIDADLERRAGELAGEGLSPVAVARDGAVVLLLGIGDPVREDARASLEALLRAGHRLAVLSGDDPRVVAAVASGLGVPFEVVRGGATPEEKLEFVEQARARGPVFMVGDGVNDAAALTAATVGIAVHGGAEASLSAADVFATRAGLEPIVALVEGSRRTLRVIRGNLARSLVYNLTVGALAALGHIGPLLAALLMPVSSIGVVASAYRSRTFGVRP